MNKEDILKIIDLKFSEKNKVLLKSQVERYENIQKQYASFKNKYKVGDLVHLEKGTMLHGTYKNIDGLREIVKNGLIASEFTNGRKSKYPACVSVWCLKNDYLLKDYINFYSGATIKYNNLLVDNNPSEISKTDIISYDQMNYLNDILSKNPCRIWHMEQTKEIRFMPSLVFNQVQIGIIFNSENLNTKELTKYDVLDSNIIDDELVKEYVNPDYYDNFIIDRNNKDDLFTDREKAVIFGIPSNLIEGILVGREYEKDINILREIKDMLPKAYICNLDGEVIIN